MKNASKFLQFFGVTMLSTILSMGAFAATDSQLILAFDKADPAAPIVTQYRAIPGLRASASGQFSADELPKLLAAIPVPRQKIWIVDLRQESHGFIDGIAVSWRSAKNAANNNKTAVEIQKIEAALVQDLSKQKAVTVYDFKVADHGVVLPEKPVTLIPESIETENQLVTSYGVNYKRLYVLDHNKPSDLEVDKFVEFYRSLKAKDWLHFHCHAGKGRASTFMAMYDILQNAPRTSFADIMLRQEAVGNKKLNQLPTAADKLWKAQAAKERYEFIKDFYAYVVDPNGLQIRNWSSWKAQKNSQK